MAEPKLKQHPGRIVKTTGDGLLLEFVSVVDAVRYALEIQCEMALKAFAAVMFPSPEMIAVYVEGLRRAGLPED